MAMIDAGSIIGALMEGAMSGAGAGRLQNALGPKGLGQAGLGDVLGSLLGAGQQGGASLGGALGNMLGGQQGGLGDMLGNALNKVNTSGLGNAAIGGVLGSLFGGGSGVGGVAKGGAMAMLGMLAVNALKDYLANQAKDPAQQSSLQLMTGMREAETEQEQRQLQDLAQLTLRAMVNAAKADGSIDTEELQKITGRLQENGVADEDLKEVQAMLQAPMDTDAIINAAQDPQVAAQIYAASLMAIRVDTDAERDYIQQLGERLNLPQEARNHIHSMLGV